MADEKLIGTIEEARDKIQEKLIQLNRDIRTEFEALKEAMPEPAPEPEPTPPEAPSLDVTDLLGATWKIHQATTQVDLLRALVNTAGQFVPRVMLFIKKSGNLHGWAASGFGDDFVRTRLKKVRWSVDQYAELVSVVQNGVPLATDFNSMSDISAEIEQFEGFMPFKACFLPLVVKNKVAAVLYIDSGEDAQLGGSSAVELLVHVTGLELTLVAAKAKVEPKPRDIPEPEEAPAPTFEAAPEPEPVPEPEPEPEPEAPAEEASDFSYASEFEAPTEEDGPDFSEEVSPYDDVEEIPDSEPEPDFGDYDDSPDFEEVEDEAPEFVGYEEPASDFGGGFEPLPEPAAPAPPPAEEDPAIKKARRAARVLVSDLKLYNEAAVETAKKTNDLYARLKEDIDRSYQHYQERISDLNPSSDANFFKEELIRQLGDGDESVLGPLPF